MCERESAGERVSGGIRERREAGGDVGGVREMERNMGATAWRTW